MIRIKKIGMLLVAFVLIFPNHVTAQSSDDSGSVSSKNEVVYATLNANGAYQNVYVVNAFDVDEPGVLQDFGPYESVRNLTDLTDIDLEGESVTFTATDEQFFYQGNMEPGTELPWQIDVTYYLNDEEVASDELAGVDGAIRIEIETAENETFDAVFFENYMLQITLPFDTAIFSDIEAEDGIIANAGKDQQVTFTAMPGDEETFVVEGVAEGFEFDGIDIAAVPSSMSIDAPETEMEDEMRTLSDAIAEIHEGVSELSDGVSEMASGSSDLTEGSLAYRDGIRELSSSSDDLVAGSEEVRNALNVLDDSLSELDQVDMSDQDALIEGLNELVTGIEELQGALEDLEGGFYEAYAVLDAAMDAIPTPEISEEEIGALYFSAPDQEVVEKLLDVYENALAAKYTYEGLEEPGAKVLFEGVSLTLNGVIDGLEEMEAGIREMIDDLSGFENEMEGLNELRDGISALTSEYGLLHDGFVEYTSGVDELAANYGYVHAGVAGLSDGLNELLTGVRSLEDGTHELQEATDDLPEQMTQEIDEMIAEFEGSDFEVVSFVSDQDENVTSVQFVITTQSIHVDEPDEEEEQVEEPESFWDRLKALFE